MTTQLYRCTHSTLVECILMEMRKLDTVGLSVNLLLRIYWSRSLGGIVLTGFIIWYYPYLRNLSGQNLPVIK